MTTYDVIVVGAGVMGSAAAYHLAGRGRRVLLLEQFGLAHERGSSHGHSRIIRLSYDAPDYLRLAQAAYPLWRALEHEAGAELLRQTGGLDFAEAGTQAFDATRATLAGAGIPFEQLDHAELARRFPQFAMPEGTVGLYQADAGILNATRCVEALNEVAERRGAVIHANEPALELAADGAGVLVRSAQASYRAARVIVTAGSWARPLLAPTGLHLPLRVTKEQVLFFAPHAPALFTPEVFPVFVQYRDAGRSFYGFPIYGLPGVKVAFHDAGPEVAPADEDRAVDAGLQAALVAEVTRWLPQAAGPLLHAQTCRYTSTPDHQFILDLHPAHPQIVVGSPCSGHGFKFGVLFGAVLADLAERGASDLPIERFRLARFG